MKKIDKSLLFMLLVFGIYGAVGVLSSESVTAILGAHRRDDALCAFV